MRQRYESILIEIDKNRKIRSVIRLYTDILYMIEELKVIKGEIKVLDCACGTGAFSELLLKKYPCLYQNIFMVDIEPLKNQLSGTHFLKADLNKPLDFEDNYFDLIISLETVEHLFNPNSFVKELNRISKKNALLIISTPNIHNIFSRILFLLTGKMQWYRKWAIDQGHISPIYQPSAYLMFKRNRFKLIKQITTTARVLGTKITFPLRGVFWGEVSIFILKKA